MKQIRHIVGKELLDTLRDRRSLLTMIVVPLLLFPVLLGITDKVIEETGDEAINVGVCGFSSSNELIKSLKSDPKIDVAPCRAGSDLGELVEKDSLKAGLQASESFKADMEKLRTGTIHFYYKKASLEKEERIMGHIEKYKKGLLKERITQLNITRKQIEPIRVEKVDRSTKKEFLGKTVGGFLPYVFVIFCFMGCMYPAIDLFSGEKERGTIETLLTLPVKRIHLLIGKMVVIVITGLTSALISLAGLLLGLQFIDILPDELMGPVNNIMTPTFIVQLLLMLIPLTIFFAGLLIPLSIRARSFKEAQSSISPLNILVIIPVFFGLLPGIELSFATALIPVVNVALTTKEMIAGTLSGFYFFMTILSLLVFAAISVFISVRLFGNEEQVLR